MKAQIIDNLKYDRGLSPEQIIYMIEYMIVDDSQYGYVSPEQVRFQMTEWLMNNHLNQKERLMIVESLIEEDDTFESNVLEMCSK